MNNTLTLSPFLCVRSHGRVGVTELEVNQDGNLMLIASGYQRQGKFVSMKDQRKCKAIWRERRPMKLERINMFFLFLRTKKRRCPTKLVENQGSSHYASEPVSLI
jgi:hypothetical protein